MPRRIQRGLLKLFDGRSGIFFPLLGFGVRIQHPFWVLVLLLGLRGRTAAELLEWFPSPSCFTSWATPRLLAHARPFGRRRS